MREPANKPQEHPPQMYSYIVTVVLESNPQWVCGRMCVYGAGEEHAIASANAIFVRSNVPFKVGSIQLFETTD